MQIEIKDEDLMEGENAWNKEPEIVVGMETQSYTFWLSIGTRRSAHTLVGAETFDAGGDEIVRVYTGAQAGIAEYFTYQKPNCKRS